MDEWYTADLVNGLGNLVARVMKMAETNGVKVLVYEYGYPKPIADAVTTYEFDEAMNHIWSKTSKLDEKITEKEPFKVVKSDPALGQAIIQELVIGLHEVATELQPFMPETSKTIMEAIKANKKPENLFARLES
jgi:methionyl-tRNA synthetase